MRSRCSQFLTILGATLFCAASGLHCHGDARGTAPAAVDPPGKAPSPPPSASIRTLPGLDSNAARPPLPPQVPVQPLRVLDFGPQGRTDIASSVHVRFNQPVGSLELNDDQQSTPQIVTVPALKGRTYFQSPELLVFEWEGHLTDATRYQASLHGPVVAPSGARFEQPVTWEFESRRPKVDRSQPSTGAVDVSRTTPLFLYFEQPTTAAEVSAHLQLRAFAIGKAEASAHRVPFAVNPTTEAESKKYDLDWRSKEKGISFTVRPQPLWPADSEVIAAVTPGLRATVGPLPLDTPFTTRFHTITVLKLESAGCAAATPCGLEPIALSFNNPLVESQWKRITLTPEPPGFARDLVDTYSNLGSKQAQFSGVFLPGHTYTVNIPAGLTDGYGQQLGRAITHQAVIARRPTLELDERRGTLTATNKRTIGVVSRHIQALRVRAVVLEDHELLELSLGDPAKRTKRENGSDWENVEHEADRVDHFPWPTAGRPLIERTIALSPKGPTAWSSISVDLGELLDKARRAVLVEVSAASLVPGVIEPTPNPVRGLYRITDLGPVLLRSQPKSLVMLTRLSTHEPVAGASVAVLDQQPSAVPKPLGTTDKNGLLELPGVGDDFVKAAGRGDLFVFSDTPNDDHAYLPVLRHEGGYSYSYSHSWSRRHRYSQDIFETDQLRPGERLIARIVTERDAYLPGERVRAVGWAAIDTPYARSGLVRPPAGTPVELTLTDRRSQKVATVLTTITREGKFWAELPLPATDSLGSFVVGAKLLGATTQTYVKVEDFRVPEFAVTAGVSATDVIASIGESVDTTPTVRASASYYFGGQVKIRRASYQHGCSTMNYRPPGLNSEWVVGEYHSDARHSERAIDISVIAGDRLRDAEQGRLSFTPGREQQIPGYPNHCVIDVDAGDASFQSYGARTDYIVHPARYYLAVRSPTSIEEGHPVSIAVRAVGYDGQRSAARNVQVTIERHYREPVFRTEAGKRVFDREEDKKELFRKTSIDLPPSGPDGLLNFTAGAPGDYQITLQGSASDHARDAHTHDSFAVYPKVKQHPVAAPRPAARHLELLVDNAQVKPSDAVDVTLRGPWPAHGVLAMARNGLREQIPFTVSPTADTHLLLRADDTWYPQVTMEALVVRPGLRGLPNVDRLSEPVKMGLGHRRLTVQVDAPMISHAGAKVPITVHVTDFEDRPLGGGDTTRVALWAVDEAVLELTGYHVPDLLPSFMPFAESRLATNHDFASLILPYVIQSADPWLSPSGRAFGSANGSGMGSGGMGGSVDTARSVSRQKFEITPLFLADLPVGPDGWIKVEAKLPDNLTTFRITAVASARLVDGESPGRFGSSDTRLRVTAPLIVRPALPRILRPGDDAEAAALVNNLGGPPGELTVTVRVLSAAGKKEPPNELRFLGTAESHQSIEAGAVVRVPFHLLAERPGRPEVELTAVLLPRDGGAPLRDSVRLPVPVEVERTLIERVATYGTLATDQPVAIPLGVPRDADPRQGGLSIDVTSSLLGDLTGAARALVGYPYGCVEQTASRLLPMLSMAELRKNGFLRGEVGDVDEFIAAGVQRILGMQTDSGGFSYWPGGKEPSGYATAYATWILTLAQQSGVAVPKDSLARAAKYLHTLAGAEQGAFREPLQGIHAAIAAHALSEMGEKIPALLDKLYTQRAELPIFGRAFLLLAFTRAAPGDPRAATLTEELLGSLAEAPADAHVVERIPYSLDSIFYSESRSDAITLLALLRARPDHPVLLKLARGLLDRRAGSAWRNTQENAYSLLALSEFARHYEREAPNLTGSAWIGQTLLAQVQLSDRTAKPHSALVPMARLLAPLAAAEQNGGAMPVILQRTGSGRMYYRVGLEWSPKDANPPPRAQGLRVLRSLRDATHELGADEVITAGSALAFELRLENRVPIHYLAIDIPLPAGLEAIQTNLNPHQNRIPFSGPRGHFISHEEAWKDRIVLFADELLPGDHAHTIYLRATTPGRYTLPPAHAEAMYTPEIYGRSAGGVVNVR